MFFDQHSISFSTFTNVHEYFRSVVQIWMVSCTNVG